MNILFLSLIDFNTFADRNIYSDLLREFIKNGHRVYCVSPVEMKNKQKTHTILENDNCILKLRIGNTQKVNLIEKGLSTLLIEPLFILGIRKYFSGVKFDLILYATPPITFAKVIRYIKKRDGARTYLLLKDIFPQNAIDLNALSKRGVKGVIYRFFRHKEKQLYGLSDKIGCMSEANVEFVLEHNRYLPSSKVEVCPNCVEIRDLSITEDLKASIREKYKLPLDKRIFVYGGNLGRPQGVPFILDCIKKCADINDAFFLIVGNGTEGKKISDYVNKNNPTNIKYMQALPKDEYDSMIGACDVGLIFLDYRFTIPNFPSRLLSYMQSGLPVIAATDPNSDIGKVIEENRMGYRCSSNDALEFYNIIKKMVDSDDYATYKQRVFECLNENYSVQRGYKIIMDSFEARNGE